MTTFVNTARHWWGAHRKRQPTLRLIFSQLCKWITGELVPSASYSSAIEAWADLRFKANIDNYLQKLDNLRFHHPIDPCAAHALTARPFGAEFVARIKHLDKEAGEGGMPYPAFKQLLQAYYCDRGAQRAGWGTFRAEDART